MWVWVWVGVYLGSGLGWGLGVDLVLDLGLGLSRFKLRFRSRSGFRFRCVSELRFPSSGNWVSLGNRCSSNAHPPPTLTLRPNGSLSIYGSPCQRFKYGSLQLEKSAIVV